MLNQNFVFNDSFGALYLDAPDEFAMLEHDEAGCRIENSQLEKDNFSLLEEIDIVNDSFNYVDKIVSPSHEGSLRKTIEKKDLITFPCTFVSYEDASTKSLHVTRNDIPDDDAHMTRNKKRPGSVIVLSTSETQEEIKHDALESILIKEPMHNNGSTDSIHVHFTIKDVKSKVDEPDVDVPVTENNEKRTSNVVVLSTSEIKNDVKDDVLKSILIKEPTFNNGSIESGFHNLAEVTRFNMKKLDAQSCTFNNQLKHSNKRSIGVLEYALDPSFEGRELFEEGGPKMLKIHGDETETEINEAEVKEQSSIKSFFENVFKAEPTSKKTTFKKLILKKPNFEKLAFKKPNFEKLAFKKPNFEKLAFKKPNFEKLAFKKPDFEKLSFKKSDFKNLTFKKPAFKRPNFHFKRNFFHKQKESSDPTNKEGLNIKDERLECDLKVEASEERYDDSVVFYFMDLPSPTRQDHVSRFDYDELLSNEEHLKIIIVGRNFKNCLQINANNQLRKILNVGASQLEDPQKPFISPIETVKNIQSWSLDESKDARKALKNQHTRLQDEYEQLRFILVSIRNLDLEILNKSGFKPQGINIEDIIDSYNLEIDDLKIKIIVLDSQIKKHLSRKKSTTFTKSLTIKNRIEEYKNDDEAPKMPEVDEDDMIDMEALHLYTQYLRTIYEKKLMEVKFYLGKKETSSKSVETQLNFLEWNSKFKDVSNVCSSSVAGCDKYSTKNVSGGSTDSENYKLEIDDSKIKIEEMDFQIKELLSENKLRTFVSSLKIKNKKKENKNDDEPPRMPEVVEDSRLDMDALQLYTQYLRTIYEKKSVELNTYPGKKGTSSKSVVTSAVKDQAIKNNEDGNEKHNEPPDPTNEEGLNIVDERFNCIPKNVTGVSADVDSYNLEIDDLKYKIEELDSQIKELRSRNKFKAFMRSLKLKKKIKEDKDDEPPKMPEVDENGMLDMDALHSYTQYLRTTYEKKSMELDTYPGKKETSSKSAVTSVVKDQAIENNKDADDLGILDKKEYKPRRNNIDDAVDTYKLEIDDLKNKIEELDSQSKELRSRNKFRAFMRPLKRKKKIKEDKDDEPPKMPEVDEDGRLDMDALHLYTQNLRTNYEKKSMELNTYLGKKEPSSKSVATSVKEDQAIKNNEVAIGSKIASHDGETQVNSLNSKSEIKDVLNKCSSSVAGCDKNQTKDVTGVSVDNQVQVKGSKRINVFKTPENSFNTISKGNKNVEILHDERPILKGTNSTQLPINQVPESVQNQRRKINEGFKLVWRVLKKLFKHANEENENIVDDVPIHHEENENIVNHVPIQQESTHH